MTPRPDIADRPARVLIVDDERHNRQLLEVIPAQEKLPLVTRHSLRAARHTGRILLVEDNDVNQRVARQLLLEKRGHTVVVANNGLEALATLDESEADGFGCVLMDVHMPEMDGLECTAAITRAGTGDRGSSLHRRDDCSGDERRCGALPRAGNGRLSIEAHSTGRSLRAD